jgi:hypothetical protein
MFRFAAITIDTESETAAVPVLDQMVSQIIFLGLAD